MTFKLLTQFKFKESQFTLKTSKSDLKTNVLKTQLHCPPEFEVISASLWEPIPKINIWNLYAVYKRGDLYTKDPSVFMLVSEYYLKKIDTVQNNMKSHKVYNPMYLKENFSQIEKYLDPVKHITTVENTKIDIKIGKQIHKNILNTNTLKNYKFVFHNTVCSEKVMNDVTDNYAYFETVEDTFLIVIKEMKNN